MVSLQTFLLDLGSYTDRKGRRFALMLPMIGVICRCLIFIIQQITSLPLEVTIIGTLLDGIGGTSNVLRVTVYAYIADEAEVWNFNRSEKILLADTFYTFLQAGLQVAMGYMIQAVGFTWPFVMLIGIHVINLLYTIFLLPESRPKTVSQVKSSTMILESFKVSAIAQTS